MHVLLSVICCDFKRFFKDLQAILLLIAVPVLFISVMGTVFAPYMEKTAFLDPFKIVVVDNEKSQYTDILIRQLEQIDIFEKVIRTDEDIARRLIQEDEIAAALVIPESFTTNMARGINLPVKVIGNRARPLQSRLVKTLAESAANSVSAGQSAINTIYYFNEIAGMDEQELYEKFESSVMDVFLKALSRLDVFRKVSAFQTYDVTPFEYYTAALLPVFMLFAGMPAVKMMVEEKKSGLTVRLRSTPAKFWHSIISKLLLTCLLNIIQFSIIITFSVRFFGSFWNIDPGSLLILLSGLIFSVSCWSVFISCIPTSFAAVDLVSYVGILFMSVISGGIYPLHLLPPVIRNLSLLTVTRWAMDGFLAIFSGWKNVNMWQYAVPLYAIGAGLLAAAILALWVFPKILPGRKVLG